MSIICLILTLIANCLQILFLLLVDAGRIVHRLHPAGGDGLHVDLILVLGQGGQAAGGEGKVGHLVVARITSKWLKMKNYNFNFSTSSCQQVFPAFPTDLSHKES